MYLHSIANAVPPHSFSQSSLLESFKASETLFKDLFQVNDEAWELGLKIFQGDSGIDTRHFAREDLQSLYTLDAGELNQLFEEEAPAMSVNALKKALDKSGTPVNEIDALFICTCTGYICPGITSHVAEQLGIRPDAYLNDMVGLGCGAAVPLVRVADAFIAANPDATVAAIAVESCSSVFYICSDFGAIISLCLFGDGASASIWKGTPGETGFRTNNFQTVHLPHHREKIRFVNDSGKLRNKLHVSVPGLAAKAVSQLYQKRSADKPKFLSHTGGRDVLNAIEEECKLAPIEESREILRRYGNTSSPSVMIALEEYLSKGDCEDNLWLTAFGAGFACHSFEMVRE